MSQSLPQKVIRLADLAGRKEFSFVIEPDSAGRDAIVAELALRGLRKLRFEGALRPLGRTDWRLEARLGATAVQDCVVTLDPVTTRIDESVTRSYVAEMPEIEPGEVEMPEDDTVDPLPVTLDLAEVMIEALALALPAFPRAEGAELGSLVVTAPGLTPMTDEVARPFAGLGALKKALEKKDDKGD